MLKLKRLFVFMVVWIIQRIRIGWYSLLSTNRAHGVPVRYQPVCVAGNGRIIFDQNVRIGVRSSSGFMDSYAYIEARNPSACISIGFGTWINNGFCCVADHASITIGRNCLIGTNVEIIDSDFHGIRVSERGISKAEWAASVTVEDDVFIGSNVRILKGVRIGAGSVIANSSVVVGDIPPMVIAAGMPARVVNKLAE